jgi:hypothetical protein
MIITRRYFGPEVTTRDNNRFMLFPGAHTIPQQGVIPRMTAPAHGNVIGADAAGVPPAG